MRSETKLFEKQTKQNKNLKTPKKPNENNDTKKQKELQKDQEIGNQRNQIPQNSKKHIN